MDQLNIWNQKSISHVTQNDRNNDSNRDRIINTMKYDEQECHSEEKSEWVQAREREKQISSKGMRKQARVNDSVGESVEELGRE